MFVYRYRQAWEIYQCLFQNKNWVKINFADGLSFVARIDYLGSDITSGFISRKDITLLCQGTPIETIPQSKDCLEKWIQIKLPNNIILSFYLNHFSEKYIGGYFSTNDLLVLSEQVRDIECYDQPL